MKKEIEEEIKNASEIIEFDSKHLRDVLFLSRQQKHYVSLEEIAQTIKEVLKEEEVEALIKKLE